MKEKLKRMDVLVGLGLFAFFAFCSVQALSFPGKAGQFPLMIGCSVLIIITLFLVISLTRKTVEEIKEIDDTELSAFQDKQTRKARMKRLGLAWGVILVSSLVGYLAGFLFLALLLFSGFSAFFGSRENLRKNLVIAAALTIVTYLIFDWVMGVPLLRGIFD
jgi:putative tricarboxylic transport membrane protein